jgi:SpoIID/LytB domain protein
MRSTYHRLCKFLTILAATLATPLLCVGAASASDLVINGAGEGHGVGMSQEGALGYALHGAGYREILSHYYTGTRLGQAPPQTQVRVLVRGHVRQIALETYVRGVVSAEIPSSWPMAALEAQAVASRTYALTAHAGGSRFDVYSDSRSQVYRGAAAETPETNAAVAATAGQVVTYEGLPAITYFSASSGGRTENVENVFLGAQPEPWLRGVPDPFDQGPLHRWKLTISFTSAAERLRGLLGGSFQGIEVLRRGLSPRIVSAYVLGSTGRTIVSGSELATRLGLYDKWAYFSVQNGALVRPEPDLSGRAQPPNPSPPLRPPASVSSRDGGAQAPGATTLTTTGGAAARPASASGAYSVGSHEQIAWVRRAASNFLTAELAGNGAGACAILTAALRATQHHRTCAQRWNAKLAKLLREPRGRARLRAQARAIPSAVVAVHGDVASIDLPARLMNGANRFLWTENCWMLEG